MIIQLRTTKMGVTDGDFFMASHTNQILALKVSCKFFLSATGQNILGQRRVVLYRMFVNQRHSLLSETRSALCQRHLAEKRSFTRITSTIS